MHTWWEVIFCSPPSPTTHTLQPPKSLSGGRVPLRNKRLSGTENKERGGALTKREASKTTVVFFCLLVLEACGRQACFNVLQVLGKDMPRMLGGGRLCVSRHTPFPKMQVPPCGLLSTCRSWHRWTGGSRCTHVWSGFSRRDNHSKCACVTAARGAASIPSTRGVACCPGDALRC